jgi:hypothetical protein
VWNTSNSLSSVLSLSRHTHPLPFSLSGQAQGQASCPAASCPAATCPAGPTPSRPAPSSRLLPASIPRTPFAHRRISHTRVRIHHPAQRSPTSHRLLAGYPLSHLSCLFQLLLASTHPLAPAPQPSHTPPLLSLSLSLSLPLFSLSLSPFSLFSVSVSVSVPLCLLSHLLSPLSSFLFSFSSLLSPDPLSSLFSPLEKCEGRTTPHHPPRPTRALLSSPFSLHSWHLLFSLLSFLFSLRSSLSCLSSHLSSLFSWGTEARISLADL